MTQGELEQIPLPFESQMSSLEMRIMSEIVRSIKVNGFSTATADYQIQRLVHLGKSEKDIRQWIQGTLEATDEEIDRIFSDTVYGYYYGYERAYQLVGAAQVPFAENRELQELISATRKQTQDIFRNMTNSMGFAIRNPATGRVMYSSLMEFYQNVLDDAVMDIMSGTASYDKALSRAVNAMTNSGVRWIDYDSGWHNRVNVAARRAVMTGFRQVQGKINEQVAKELGTDSYEVTYHVGARPSHQPWQGRVWTYEQLVSVCGLGSVIGLHGANCYHDYNAFIPGVSVRTYTDEQLEQMIAEENTPKFFNGKEYTTYEALQEQRRMETAMRKTRQDIKLLQDGGAERDTITLKQARYQGQMQQYKSFSSAMGLPEQKNRVYLDGLGNTMFDKKTRVAAEKALHTKDGKYNVNWKIVKSKTYTERFNVLSGNEKANLLAAKRARNSLVNRDGKNTEEIYAISLTSGKAVSSILNQKYPFAVKRTNKFDGDVARAEKAGNQVLFIHNHPNGTPPSIADINELLNHKNAVGITVGHTGTLYYYSKPDKKIKESDFNIALRKEKYYNGNMRTEKAIERLAEQFGFEFKIL